MNNKQLEYAILLSEELNFSSAAKELGISQPALSKQISSLEKELGTELFIRNKSSLVLSASGEYFFRHVKELLYREEQLVKSMGKFKNSNCGKLTIGVSPFRSLYLLPEVLKAVKEKYPDVKIVLDEKTSDVLKNNVADGKYDFAIVNLPVDNLILDAVSLEQDRLFLVVPEKFSHLMPKYGEKEMPEVDFKDLKNLPFIVVSKSQEMRQLFERFCQSTDVYPDISMEVVGLATAWEMANSGIGATLLPYQFIKSKSFGENIKLYALNYKGDIRQPAVVTRKDQFLPEYAKYAIELLTDTHNRQNN